MAKYSIGITSLFEERDVKKSKYYELCRKHNLIDNIEIIDYEGFKVISINSEIELYGNSLIEINKPGKYELKIKKNIILILIINEESKISITDESGDYSYIKIINNSKLKLIDKDSASSKSASSKKYRSIMAINNNKESDITIKSFSYVKGNLDYNIVLFQKHGKSELDARAVLHDNSMAIMRGNIIIPHGSRKIDGSLNIKMMNIGRNARAIPMPSLEISSNDVKCTHSAVVYNINKDHLYYLMSRGIRDAKDLMIKSFMSEGNENGY